MTIKQRFILITEGNQEFCDVYRDIGSTYESSPDSLARRWLAYEIMDYMYPNTHQDGPRAEEYYLEVSNVRV